jgi:hypothetical protein
MTFSSSNPPDPGRQSTARRGKSVRPNQQCDRRRATPENVVYLSCGQDEADGLPRASTLMLIFVLRPPRERPIASFVLHASGLLSDGGHWVHIPTVPGKCWQPSTSLEIQECHDQAADDNRFECKDRQEYRVTARAA